MTDGDGTIVGERGELVGSRSKGIFRRMNSGIQTACGRDVSLDPGAQVLRTNDSLPTP